MEHPDPHFPNGLVRLAAYEKAGFKKVDPALVRYFQPDFRPPNEIDASGGPRLLPFGLVLRRVGREEEQIIPGAEVREIVDCLYRMYGTGFREQDMAAVWQSLRDYPDGQANILCWRPRDDHGVLPSRIRRADRRSHHADAQVRARGGRA